VYKLLLCWRYLRTRFLALVCIVSVMLGVATLIVVNSVMAGFSTKLKQRLHGLLSDVVIEGPDLDGFGDPYGLMARIREDPFLDERIVAMTPTMEVIALIQFNCNGRPMVRMVRLIGIDAASRGAVGGFSEYLLDERNRASPSFELRGEALQRYQEARRRNEALALRPVPPLPVEAQLPEAGWWLFNQDKAGCACAAFGSGGSPLGALFLCGPGALPAPARWKPPPAAWVKEAPPPPPGIIPGFAIAHYRDKEEKGKEVRALGLGDKVSLLTIGGSPEQGDDIDAVKRNFVVVDYIKTEMSDYDNNYAYVPLDYLQRERRLEGRATSILIKLKDYADAPAVVERLEKLVQGMPVNVLTWEKKQGALLAAISIEKGILNVLLFLIIAVAGFGILAIFSMIVIEKTRDIGILKALGASNGGVLNIFLGYGLLLGVVGAGLGTLIGLSIACNINPIEQFITRLTGAEVFDRSVYYFKDIPTDVQPVMVVLVNVGAVAIAVLFSVLPALRAAMLHPVRALRYE
jgi:lipoprotein-releasing system permease protein